MVATSNDIIDIAITNTRCREVSILFKLKFVMTMIILSFTNLMSHIFASIRLRILLFLCTVNEVI